MGTPIIDDELWALIEPLLPTRRQSGDAGNIQAAARFRTGLH
ncbi:hypothetical protein SAMN05446635_3452 [Burkholderia sp. OK233]|nr:hypothetical protein SAMN05446635_3452 [Burkholderia sp. OK233]